MSALVPRIQKLVFENKQLAVSKTMRDAMKGTCLTLDEYRTSHTPFPDNWQCAAAENDNFGESAYCPSERVIKSLSQYAGVSMETFSKFHLRSTNESDALYGKWCGMPAPPEYEHPYGGVVGARVFWEDHNGRFGLRLQTGKYEVKYGICTWLIHFHTTRIEALRLSHQPFCLRKDCVMRNAGYFNALVCATCLKLLCQGATQLVVPLILNAGCGTSGG